MKKILIVSDCPSHPIIGGNRMCIMQYCQLLEKIGYDVYYLFVDSRNALRKDVDSTRNYWNNKYFSYSLPIIQLIAQKIGQKLIKKYNIDNVDMYCPWGLLGFINNLQKKYHFHGMIVNYIWLSHIMASNIEKKIMFTHDVFSFRNERINGTQWFSFSPNEEAKALKRCSNIFSIQENESLYYSFLAPKSQIFTVYSVFRYINLPITNNKNLLFFSGAGKLNIDAILNFIYDVFPFVIKKDPEIKLLIGGKICDELEKKISHINNILFLGTFNNPMDFYKKGDIVINPVSEGTGLKIKTFEAISHGKIVIANSHSLNGIYRKEQAPLYIANNINEYLEHIFYFIENKSEISNNKILCEKYINELNQYITDKYIEILDK